MAILRNYDGNPVINDVCKELVKILPDGSSLTNELTIIMQSTGVVSGEYGFVEAYKKKIEEIQPWLQDESPSIKEFAQNYIMSLEKRIEYEQKRADEDITLRKHQYGADEV
jgi:beta-lactamase class D